MPAPAGTLSEKCLPSKSTLRSPSWLCPSGHPLSQAVRNEVQEKSEGEEQCTDSEDRLIFQRSVRCVAQADLDNVSRHRFNRNAGVESELGLLSRGNGNDHGLAERPRDTQNDGSADSRKCGRQNHLKRCGQLRCTQSIRSLSKIRWNRINRVFTQRR